MDQKVALEYASARPFLLSMGDELLNPQPNRSSRPSGNFGEGAAYIDPAFDDGQWRSLSVPHDWGVEGPFDQALPGETGKLPWAGVGWYRKHFKAPELNKGAQLSLHFDGAMANALVWCNGRFVGGWPNGYTSWQVDLTGFVKPGLENVIAIRLENLPESSRWYPGSGLYRSVWLEKTPSVHVVPWGLAVSTVSITPTDAVVKVAVEVHDATGNPDAVQIKHATWDKDLSLREFTVTHRIFRADASGRATGDPVAVSEGQTIALHDGYTGISVATIKVLSPHLWSVDSPERYQVETSVRLGEQLFDRVETTFGIRSAVFTADQGFLLNGKRVQIQGVCMHHDLGALGSAINYRALERRIELLKEMGCNAIRTSHNPPAPELLELCDRLGLIVMDESFDCWEVMRKPNGYHLLFADWYEKDFRAQIRRDRNHPSVVLWSIGNEVGEQCFPEPWRWARRLTSLAHEEDPTRPTTSGYCIDSSAYNGLQEAVDVTGLNYRPHLYAEFKKRNPSRPLVGSETSSTVSSRGEYFFPVTDNKLQGLANFQISSYDLSAGEWATLAEEEFRGQDQNPFVAGEFVWTGFDYLGEPSPYWDFNPTLPPFTDSVLREQKEKELAANGRITGPSRSSYFGIMDLAGFPKDRYYLYQARWRPDLPMAHILPHWNWPERIGQITPVHVYSSGDEAELFLNGKSLGKKRRGPLQYRFRWDDVNYEPGQLKVIVYKNGKPWANAEQSTAGSAAKLLLEPDRTTLTSDGNDLSFITVKVVDLEKRIVPRSKAEVHFSLSGPGEILAVDNGDPTSFEPFHAQQRKAFNGLAQVIVRTKHSAPGEIILRATSPDLAAAEIVLKSVVKSSAK